jgi:hypothetical protein
MSDQTCKQETISRRDLSEIMTEQEVLDLTGLKKNSLARLRNEKGLPFCPMTRMCRIYLTADIVNYLESCRRVINKDA